MGRSGDQSVAGSLKGRKDGRTEGKRMDGAKKNCSATRDLFLSGRRDAEILLSSETQMIGFCMSLTQDGGWRSFAVGWTNSPGCGWCVLCVKSDREMGGKEQQDSSISLFHSRYSLHSPIHSPLLSSVCSSSIHLSIYSFIHFAIHPPSILSHASLRRRFKEFNSRVRADRIFPHQNASVCDAAHVLDRTDKA